MKVLWLLPDDSILELSMNYNLTDLLAIINSVSSISINGLTYKYVDSELVIDDDQMCLAVSLE
jgi:hypothetical protein